LDLSTPSPAQLLHQQAPPRSFLAPGQGEAKTIVVSSVTPTAKIVGRKFVDQMEPTFASSSSSQQHQRVIAPGGGNNFNFSHLSGPEQLSSLLSDRDGPSVVNESSFSAAAAAP
ncbi:unnamed protein product, partial [Amoebophrya sp. A120]